jgi:hypothetical protein
MDAFERFWLWAEKPLDSSLTISADLHRAVMELSPDDRRDRAKVNEAAGQAESKDRPEGGTSISPALERSRQRRPQKRANHGRLSRGQRY